MGGLLNDKTSWLVLLVVSLAILSLVFRKSVLTYQRDRTFRPSLIWSTVLLLGAICASVLMFTSQPFPHATPLLQFEYGTLSLEAPSSFIANVPQEIVATVTVNGSLTERSFKEAEKTRPVTLQPDGRIRVTLTDGPEVKIVGASPALLAYRGEPLQWRWVVTGQHDGIYPLVLTLTSIAIINGKETDVGPRTLNHTLAVERNWRRSTEEFISKHVEWLFAAILLPLLVLFWNWLKERRKQPFTWN